MKQSALSVECDRIRHDMNGKVLQARHMRHSRGTSTSSEQMNVMCSNAPGKLSQSHYVQYGAWPSISVNKAHIICIDAPGKFLHARHMQHSAWH